MLLLLLREDVGVRVLVGLGAGRFLTDVSLVKCLLEAAGIVILLGGVASHCRVCKDA